MGPMDSTVTRGLMKWRFPGNDNGEIKGINDAGVHTFSANSFRSLVRESIQNSLDAVLDPLAPVEVEFSFASMKSADFPQAVAFRSVLDACDEMSSANEDARLFFENAKDTFDKQNIMVLRISDYNTTGLTGAQTCEIGSQWSRLVKESGSSNKAATSGGSFGIGKYASFACSSFRTVFFSSLDSDGVESSIGVTRLVSFRDEENEGRITTGIGYYSDNDSNIATLRQIDLSCAKRRAAGESGTDLYILGFKERGEFIKDAIFSVLEDFLVSVWKGKLIVRIIQDGMPPLSIDSKTLGECIGVIPPDTEDINLRDTVKHYELLSNIGSSGVHVVDFDPDKARGITKKIDWKPGDCRLIFMEGDGLNRTVMVTRAAGMRLFEKGHISGSIYFTGILLIEGEQMNRDFREMEAPSHDSWSPELAQNSKLAKKKITVLSHWIKDTIVGALTKPIEDSIDAYGLSLFLPQDDGRGAGGDKADSIERKPVDIKVKKTTSKKQDAMAMEPAKIKPDAQGNAVRKGSKKGKGTGKNGRSVPGDKEGFSFVPVRSRLMSGASRGLYRVCVDAPCASDKAFVKVNLVGEKTKDAADIFDAKVVAGDAKILEVRGDKVIFGPIREGERLVMEFDPGFDQYCQMEVSYYAAQ